MDDFYKYIVKNHNGFSIVKNNENHGTYRRLSDALYERDRLVKANWCWDDALQLEETENFYERMTLPKFVHEYSYIYKTPQTFMVYKDGKYMGKTNNKTDAYKYAESIGGKVKELNEVYRVQKCIDGKTRHFGQYKTYEEARKRRDELIEKGWIDEPTE